MTEQLTYRDHMIRTGEIDNRVIAWTIINNVRYQASEPRSETRALYFALLKLQTKIDMYEDNHIELKGRR